MSPIALLLIFYVTPSVCVIGSVCYVIRYFGFLSGRWDEVPFDEVLTSEKCEK